MGLWAFPVKPLSIQVIEARTEKHETHTQTGLLSSPRQTKQNKCYWDSGAGKWVVGWLVVGGSWGRCSWISLSLRPPPPPVHVSRSIRFQTWWTSSPEHPPPVHVYYSVLIQNCWAYSLEPPPSSSPPSPLVSLKCCSELMNILSGASPSSLLLVQCLFLIQVLFQADEHLVFGSS